MAINKSVNRIMRVVWYSYSLPTPSASSRTARQGKVSTEVAGPYVSYSYVMSRANGPDEARPRVLSGRVARASICDKPAAGLSEELLSIEEKLEATQRQLVEDVEHFEAGMDLLVAMPATDELQLMLRHLYALHRYALVRRRRALSKEHKRVELTLLAEQQQSRADAVDVRSVVFREVVKRWRMATDCPPDVLANFNRIFRSTAMIHANLKGDLFDVESSSSDENSDSDSDTAEPTEATPLVAPQPRVVARRRHTARRRHFVSATPTKKAIDKRNGAPTRRKKTVKTDATRRAIPRKTTLPNLRPESRCATPLTEAQWQTALSVLAIHRGLEKERRRRGLRRRPWNDGIATPPSWPRLNNS